MQPFSILLGLGALAGLLLAGWRAPKKEASRYLDGSLGILLGALLGSRAVAVAVNYSYYQAHPGEIVQVWLGGLSGIGAMAGGSRASAGPADGGNIDFAPGLGIGPVEQAFSSSGLECCRWFIGLIGR